MIRRVALAISGGVDSAVAALLLKTRGFNIEAIFMQNWDIVDEKGGCRSDDEYKDARYVCDTLNIKLHHVNFVKEYWNEVFCNLLKGYESGCTPNPDVLCNKKIKFYWFYKYAIEHLKMDAIATGHYARTSFGPYLNNFSPNENVSLLRAKDTKKDQTFFLCQVEQDALKRTMFPLGDLLKSEVKRIAVENNFTKLALKHESMGICFIGTRHFQDFIKEYIQDKPGMFLDIDSGKYVGEHNGIHQWTTGQRCRLQGLPVAYFVSRKRVEDNVIFVAQGTKHPALYSTLFQTSQPHWIRSQPEELEKHQILHCDFKFQHTEEWASCEVCQVEEGLVVKLHCPKRALTPGQFAVFYQGEECLGSAKIVNSGASDFTLYYLRNDTLKSAENLLSNDNKNIENIKRVAKMRSV